MKPKSVLIADDDRALTQALTIRCQELGLTVRSALDGMQAYDAICRQPPDLLILDVSMPAVTGLHLCEELAHDQRLAPIPVIILTGRSDEATVQRCESLGAHYVWKGLDTWNELKALICELLELETADDGQAASPGSADAAPAGPARILVIDDDPAISKAIKIRLEPYGVEVLRAFNGMQGYWMALKNRPSLIITDYAMPDGYGDYVLGRLQDHSLTKHIPVVLLTGRAGGPEKGALIEQHTARMGAAGFLSKPLDFDALLEVLKKHIPLKQRTAATAASSG